MTKYYTRLFSIFLFFTTFITFAQAPQKMSYQSVVRNSEGELVTSTSIGVRVSILKNSTNGTIVYSETHNTMTNENGLASIEIGGGIVNTGSFSGINWGSGIYFIQTETDPDGGTNYTISGTSQLLSVPYALYSGSSQNQGKTTILLTGAITDTEAAAQITAEFGTNTENLIIDNTTALTTVDFSVATKLIGLQITENTSLVSVNLSNVTSIYNQVMITSNPALTTINMDSCNHISKDFNILYNNALTTLVFPSLTTITARSPIDISDNNALSSVSFPSLTNMIGSTLDLSSNPNLTSFDANALINGEYLIFSATPNLTSVQLNSLVYCGQLTIASEVITAINLPTLTSGTVSLQGTMINSIDLSAFTNGSVYISSGMNSIDLPSFTNGSLGFGGDALTSINAPLLSTLTSFGLNSTGFTTLNLPTVTSIENLYVNHNPLLTALEFPALTTLKSCNIASNPILSSISLPQVQAFGGAMESNQLHFGYNALPSPQINYLLNKMANASTPISAMMISLNNQNPIAPPTGQGIIDKQALMDAGNSVSTD